MSISEQAAPTTTKSTVVAIKCLCARHRHQYRLPFPLPPFRAFACHCNSCRRAGGMLYHGALIWTYPCLNISDPVSELQRYDFGPSLDYWFCPTCSTKMYWRYKKEGSPLEIFPALLPDSFVDRSDVDLKYGTQVHVDDTMDGGVSGWIMDVDADGQVKLARRLKGGTESEDWSDSGQDTVANGIKRLQIEDSDAEQESLKVSCHCGGVEFALNVGTAKLPACLDTSESSRLFTSVEVAVWADTSVEQLHFQGDVAIESAADLDGLVSKPGVEFLTIYDNKKDEAKRYFCNRCSACVFDVGKSGSPSRQVRLAIGLIESKRGARAEDVLSWGVFNAFHMLSRGMSSNKDA